MTLERGLLMKSSSMTVVGVVAAMLLLLLFRHLDLLLIIVPVSIFIGFLATRDRVFGQRRI
jgi:uncharacterized membrane protein YhhN